MEFDTYRQISQFFPETGSGSGNPWSKASWCPVHFYRLAQYRREYLHLRLPLFAISFPSFLRPFLLCFMFVSICPSIGFLFFHTCCVFVYLHFDVYVFTLNFDQSNQIKFIKAEGPRWSLTLPQFNTFRRVRLGLKETAQRQKRVQSRQSCSSGAGLSVVSRTSWQYSSSRSSGLWMQCVSRPPTSVEPRDSPLRINLWTSWAASTRHHTGSTQIGREKYRARDWWKNYSFYDKLCFSVTWWNKVRR